jgi:aerobic-type carbon monoxide dehydrogenase small subunit (CoxS/CutS family)
MASDKGGAVKHLVLDVNGRETAIESAPDTPLLFVLRNEIGLKGAKLGCQLEQCGACAVLVDGKNVLSCNMPVEQFRGMRITTPECRNDDQLVAVKDAFIRAGAAQCGYCIPGMVIAATALLKAEPNPSLARIREALEQHLCRCGTQQRVLAAIEELANG